MKRPCRAVFVIYISAFLLFTAASKAPAQQAGPFYVGAFGAFVKPSDLAVDGHGDIKLDDSWAFGVKGGYIIPQLNWLVPEGEYTYMAKQDVDQPGFTGDIRAHNLMANLLFRYPDGEIHPFVGFGVGLSQATVGGSFDDHDTAWASQFIAGVNFAFSPNMSADLAYKWFNSTYRLSGTDAKAKSHIFQVGINFHF